MNLQREAERKVHARIARIAQVIDAVDLDHINILRVEPVAGPRVNESEVVAAVLEAVISVVSLADAERVLLSKAGLVAVGGNTGAGVLLCRLGVLFLLRVSFFRLGFRLLLLLRAGLLGLSFLFLRGLGFLFVLCCSCANTGAAATRVKDRTAAVISPISFMVVVSSYFDFYSMTVAYACLLQASGCRVNRAADGFAGNEKFNSAVLLPSGGVVVGGYGRSVAEACG